MKEMPVDNLLDAIAELRAIFPEWRFTQLVANVATAAGAVDAGAFWDMEDDQIVEAARRLIERNRGRTTAGRS
jgi:hypothetical protein